MSDLQDKYQEFFDKKLESYDVSSPAELSDEDKSKFFDEIEVEWTEGEGPSGKTIESAYDRLDALNDTLAAAGASDEVLLSAAEATEHLWDLSATESYPPAGAPVTAKLHRLNRYQKVVSSKLNRDHNVMVDIVKSANSSMPFSAHYGDSFYAHGSSPKEAYSAWCAAHDEVQFGEEAVVGMTVSASVFEPGSTVKLGAGEALVQRYVYPGKYYVFPIQGGKAAVSAKLVDADKLS